MKNKYETPEIKALTGDYEDVIMTSGLLPDDDHPGDNEVDLGL